MVENFDAYIDLLGPLTEEELFGESERKEYFETVGKHGGQITFDTKEDAEVSLILSVLR
jgi:hypothetical protein